MGEDFQNIDGITLYFYHRIYTSETMGTMMRIFYGQAWSTPNQPQSVSIFLRGLPAYCPNGAVLDIKNDLKWMSNTCEYLNAVGF